jgi:hypothetical protein
MDMVGRSLQAIDLVHCRLEEFDVIHNERGLPVSRIPFGRQTKSPFHSSRRFVRWRDIQRKHGSSLGSANDGHLVDQSKTEEEL